MIQNYIGVYSVSMSRVWVLLLAEREHTEEKKHQRREKSYESTDRRIIQRLFMTTRIITHTYIPKHKTKT